jgi:mannosyltransferase
MSWPRVVVNSRPLDRAAVVVPACLVLVGLMVTLFRIGSKSLWYDESLSVGHATAALDAFMSQVVGRDTNGILYFLILRPWIMIFGEGEGAIRALSAMFTVTAVLFVYAIGARLLGRWGGVAAAVLLLINPMTIAYAQEARAYAMAMAIAALGTWLVIDVPTSHARWRRVGYAVLMGLGVYTHLFLTFVFAAHLVWLILQVRRGSSGMSWRDLLGIVITFTVVAAPMLFFAVVGDGPDWIPPMSSDTLTWTFLALAGGSWPLIVVALIATGVSIAYLARERRLTHRSDDFCRDCIELILLWALVPIAIVVSISIFRSMLVPRYFLVSLPAFVLLVVFACSCLRWRPAMVVAYTLVFLLSLVPALAWYSTPANADWRSLTQVVASGSGPSDRVAFYPPFQQRTFDYYVRRLDLGEDVPALLRPGDLEAAAASNDQATRPQRIWLVLDYPHTGATPPALATLLDELEAARYRPWGKDRTFQGVRIRLMVDDDRRDLQEAVVRPA